MKCLDILLIGLNGTPIHWEGLSTSLSLWAGGMRLLSDNLRYQEVFDSLHQRIFEMKSSGDDICILDRTNA